MASRRSLSNSDFLTRVREYLPMDACVWATDPEGKPVGNGLPGDLFENTFYVFDPESLVAFSYAIEDIALDEANGNLLASLQHFKDLDLHCERCWQLAATIEKVEIIGCGKSPMCSDQVKFCAPGRSALKNFWVIIYQGKHTQAMLLARRCEGKAVYSHKKFCGFYTFDSELIARVRSEISSRLRCNSGGDLMEFERLQTIDRAAKKLVEDFSREKDAVESALRQLQVQKENYPEPFLSEFSHALGRLAQWKVRLPQMLANHQK